MILKERLPQCGPREEIRLRLLWASSFNDPWWQNLTSQLAIIGVDGGKAAQCSAAGSVRISELGTEASGWSTGRPIRQEGVLRIIDLTTERVTELTVDHRTTTFPPGRADSGSDCIYPVSRT